MDLGLGMRPNTILLSSAKMPMSLGSFKLDLMGPNKKILYACIYSKSAYWDVQNGTHIMYKYLVSITIKPSTDIFLAEHGQFSEVFQCVTIYGFVFHIF
jgi:hypothetical protein